MSEQENRYFDRVSAEFREAVARSDEITILELVKKLNEEWFWYWHEHNSFDEEYYETLDKMASKRNYANSELTVRFQQIVNYIKALSPKAAARYMRIVLGKSLYTMSNSDFPDFIEEQDPNGKREVARLKKKAEKQYHGWLAQQKEEERFQKLEKTSLFLRKYNQKEKFKDVDSIIERLSVE